ncbi:terpenoid synthase [Canariomyces notabilis]|uniref:Terpenoid synthase n=1 Tax=Canariomyces notabilis TaxID=2074819 RepID=A0AAN6YSN5_9PEZI|nr:terpenoid synthase [Canariomyces arenarius]
MAGFSEEAVLSIRETLSHFVSGVTGGRKIDSDALTLTHIEKLRAAVLSELESSSLRAHMGLINSKNQVTSACYVAADFNWSHPFEYQVIVAQPSIFFFHADDILEHKPEVLRQLQRNVATGQPTGDPVLDWFVRELTPKLWKHFDPLVANMLVTGLSPMYSLLALARASDPQLPTGTGSLEKYVQTIPDVIIFTNIVNDVISWYKEHLAGEQKNYIAMRAHKDGVDVVTALRTVADEGIRVYNRVLAALADEPEYRANFDAYAKGITHFHT